MVDVVGDAQGRAGVARGRLDEHVLEGGASPRTLPLKSCSGRRHPRYTTPSRRWPAEACGPDRARPPRASPAATPPRRRSTDSRVWSGPARRRAPGTLAGPSISSNLGEYSVPRVGAAIVPGHRRAGRVVDERSPGELERTVARAGGRGVHQVHVARLPVRRQAHDLALVAVLVETQPLADRGVEDAQRMREIDLAELFSGCSLPTPHMVLTKSPMPSTDRMAASPKGRDEERAGHVRAVVLDVMEGRLELARWNVECACQAPSAGPGLWRRWPAGRGRSRCSAAGTARTGPSCASWRGDRAKCRRGRVVRADARFSRGSSGSPVTESRRST